ncbi:Nuclear transcription factor Y subunit C-3 [Capsicum annuum]|uniref:Nuclear transcription factor Y subunit C-3 n=1 Tax=Capsicum annuum TaxID=4072 RepID=A0A2G2ZCS4_CAPAN|nr:Nuclear transcription factor Y subunit C-3 [Capsicum annuum]
MKADEDVRMISAETPVLFAKACEMFIQELTLRSWIHSEENKRRTLQKNDIAAAISRTDTFDFLVDIGCWAWASAGWCAVLLPSVGPAASGWGNAW